MAGAPEGGARLAEAPEGGARLAGAGALCGGVRPVQRRRRLCPGGGMLPGLLESQVCDEMPERINLKGGWPLPRHGAPILKGNPMGGWKQRHLRPDQLS
eukprot:8367426-Pyramimonas_sp.AAC.1